jgi:hypothetical protein
MMAASGPPAADAFRTGLFGWLLNALVLFGGGGEGGGARLGSSPAPLRCRCCWWCCSAGVPFVLQWPLARLAARLPVLTPTHDLQVCSIHLCSSLLNRLICVHYTFTGRPAGQHDRQPSPRHLTGPAAQGARDTHTRTRTRTRTHTRARAAPAARHGTRDAKTTRPARRRPGTSAIMASPLCAR